MDPQERFEIDEYEWCEPDYRQVLLWAKELSLDPVEVIRRLEDNRSIIRVSEDGEEEIWEATTIDRGRILKLNLDLDLLPLSGFQWIEGLEIEYLRVVRSRINAITIPEVYLPLPQLRQLHCSNLGVRQLELSGAPLLTELFCDGNRLTNIDLNQVPELQQLECARNQLGHLDLSAVHLLSELRCDRNRLLKLDIASVPRLASLGCRGNLLSDINLSEVPDLRDLFCDDNVLKELELTHVPRLTNLGCGNNQMVSIDLSNLPVLEWLDCDNNQIATLELSKVPMLRDLSCSGNRLTELHLSGVPLLRRLRCGNNSLDILDTRPLQSPIYVEFDTGSTRLIRRPDQHPNLFGAHYE